MKNKILEYIYGILIGIAFLLFFIGIPVWLNYSEQNKTQHERDMDYPADYSYSPMN